MVIAMSAVTAVDVTGNHVIDVSRVWNDGMAAADAVQVVGRVTSAGVTFRACVRMAWRGNQLVLVDVFAVDVMKMAIVNVVDVVVVLNTEMPAIVAVAVLVLVVNVMLHDERIVPVRGRGQLPAT